MYFCITLAEVRGQDIWYYLQNEFGSAMRQLFVGILTLSYVFFGRISGTTGMIFGSGDILVSLDKDYQCKGFPFNPPFASSSVVRVQLGLMSQNYHAAVAWVEEVSITSFTGCVATSGAISGSRTVNLMWMAYTSVSNRAYMKRLTISLFTSGTKCVRDDFTTPFSSPPNVFVTAIHLRHLKNKHDAASVWAEDITLFNFRACLRELKNFDGVHEYLEVDVLAMTKDNIPAGWEIPVADVRIFPNNYDAGASTGYGFCKTFEFPKLFYETPTLITTPSHAKDGSTSLIDADNFAVTEWIENVSPKDFYVCLKDIQRYKARHDPINLHYIAAGYFHPCNDISCQFYGLCVPDGPKKHKCICQNCTTDESSPLCDNNGVTHKNKCEYNYKVCVDQEEPGIKHQGGCKPFVLQLGRVPLRLDTIDVRCRKVLFRNGTFEIGRGHVRVQTTINYFNSSGSFIHDAAVTWVENVNINSFEMCALKAGRADRLTPDGGLTYIDFIAFQEAPKNSAAGQINMNNWWDGTQCLSVTYENNGISSPHVLVTAEHSVLGLKHDAATVWVENIVGNTFLLCTREMQNFDGLHKDIKMNWMVIDEVPAGLVAERTLIDFKNDDLPLPENYNSYCEFKTFKKAYSSTPTIIVSASHLNPALGYNDRLYPDYNSIASWVEQITTTSFRVCIKELHNKNGYDPVTVAAFIIGS